jgi:hypothetical protein
MITTPSYGTESPVLFDPFNLHLPGDSLPEKLRYLLVDVLRPTPVVWSPPDENLKIITLKCLYASMVGFNRDHLPLLYPSGQMGDDLDALWLTKAQLVGSSPSVRDRCCGHVFEKGETYYRCKYSNF